MLKNYIIVIKKIQKINANYAKINENKILFYLFIFFIAAQFKFVYITYKITFNFKVMDK